MLNTTNLLINFLKYMLKSIISFSEKNQTKLKKTQIEFTS